MDFQLDDIDVPVAMSEEPDEYDELCERKDVSKKVLADIISNFDMDSLIESKADLILRNGLIPCDHGYFVYLPSGNIPPVDTLMLNDPLFKYLCLCYSILVENYQVVRKHEEYIKELLVVRREIDEMADYNAIASLNDKFFTRTPLDDIKKALQQLNKAYEDGFMTGYNARKFYVWTFRNWMNNARNVEQLFFKDRKLASNAKITFNDIITIINNENPCDYSLNTIHEDQYRVLFKLETPDGSETLVLKNIGPDSIRSPLDETLLKHYVLQNGPFIEKLIDYLDGGLIKSIESHQRTEAFYTTLISLFCETKINLGLLYCLHACLADNPQQIMSGVMLTVTLNYFLMKQSRLHVGNVTCSKEDVTKILHSIKNLKYSENDEKIVLKTDPQPVAKEIIEISDEACDTD